MKYFCLNIIYYLSKMFKRSRKKIVFGAWFGEKFGDNPKYMFEYLINNYPENEYFWIGKKNHLNNIEKEYYKFSNVKFIERNSIESFWVLLTSYYAFVSHGYNDLGSINLFNGGKLIQLWHGYPIKKIVADSILLWEKTPLYFDKYDYFLAGSLEEQNRMLSGFRNKGIEKNKIIQSGRPRNDILWKTNNNAIKKKLNIDPKKIIISYLPTYRNSADIFSFTKISDKLKKRISDGNIVILEKQHFVKESKVELLSEYPVIVLDTEFDTQELLTITDILITDYSSVYADYCLLDKPIVHFLFDKDRYISNDQGTYSLFETDSCGPIIYDVDILIHEYILGFHTADFMDDKRRSNNNRFNKYSTKSNSEKIWREILEKVGE